MSKGNNKRVKQMIFDVAMQGRKLFWLGEESELFLANRAKEVQAEYFDESMTEEDMECEQAPTNWRELWKVMRSEEPIGGAKLFKNSDYYYQVPMISFVQPFDEFNPAPCVSTSYN